MFLCARENANIILIYRIATSDVAIEMRNIKVALKN